MFLELCARPECAELIYQEVESLEDLDYEGLSRLPVLDSFIKEAVRINPLDKSKYISIGASLGLRSANSFNSVYPSQSSQTIHLLEWWTPCTCWSNSVRF